MKDLLRAQHNISQTITGEKGLRLQSIIALNGILRLLILLLFLIQYLLRDRKL